MGPLNQVVGMIPGFNASMIPKGQEKESSDRIKKFLCMMDSMTKAELDGLVPITETRVIRIAKGAGQPPRELMFLLGEHKRFEKMVGRMGKMNLDGLDNMDQIKRNPQQAMKQLQSAIDPGMLKQLGGMGNIMEMVKGLSGGAGGEGGMGGMGEMMQQMMGGAGGGQGGAPDMSAMMNMAQQMMGGGGGGGMRMPPGMPKGMMRMGRR